MTALVTFGETMLVLRSSRAGRLALHDELIVSVAGAEATVAIGMARLGHEATWIGHVGPDDAGALVHRALRGEGVRVRGRIDARRATGSLLRVARTDTVTTVSYNRAGSAGAQLQPDDIDADLLTGALIVHTSGITAALGDSARETVLTTAARASTAGATVTYDVNFRSRLSTVDAAGRMLAEILPHLDILFCGEDELPVLAAATGRRSLTWQDASDLPAPRQLVVKRGRAGAVASVDGQRFERSSVPVRAVDTVGAGDAFVAGYLSATLDGLDPAARLARAATVAAFCVAGHGDWENLPTRAELALLDHPDGFTDR